MPHRAQAEAERLQWLASEKMAQAEAKVAAQAAALAEWKRRAQHAQEQRFEWMKKAEAAVRHSLGLRTSTRCGERALVGV